MDDLRGAGGGNFSMAREDGRLAPHDRRAGRCRPHYRRLHRQRPDEPAKA